MRVAATRFAAYRNGRSSAITNTRLRRSRSRNKRLAVPGKKSDGTDRGQFQQTAFNSPINGARRAGTASSYRCRRERITRDSVGRQRASDRNGEPDY